MGASGEQAAVPFVTPAPWVADEAVRHLCAQDTRLGRYLRQLGDCGLSPSRVLTPYEALAQSIVYQQLSGKAAATIHGRVKALFPRGKLDPERLLGLDDATLRGAGLSRGKLAALRDLSRRALAGEIPGWRALDQLHDDAIVERLTRVHGVGRWTVEMLLIFRLGRSDVLPVADLGVRKGFMRAFGLRELPTADELTSRAERWRPYRSVASWYLWRVAELPSGG